MRAIGFVALLFLASTAVVAQGEELFAPPQPYPAPREPAINPNQPNPSEKLPITLTAQIYHLENAAKIALDAKDIQKYGDGIQCFLSDQEFEGFLKKLNEADATREENSVSIQLTEGDKPTPIECSNNASTPAGKRSFQVDRKSVV